MRAQQSETTAVAVDPSEHALCASHRSYVRYKYCTQGIIYIFICRLASLCGSRCITGRARKTCPLARSLSFYIKAKEAPPSAAVAFFFFFFCLRNSSSHVANALVRRITLNRQQVDGRHQRQRGRRRCSCCSRLLCTPLSIRQQQQQQQNNLVLVREDPRSVQRIFAWSRLQRK